MLQDTNAQTASLSAKISAIYAIRSAMALQGWDQETKMPHAASQGRSLMQAELASILHQRMTSPEFLEELQSGILNAESEQKRCYELMLQDCLRKAKIPADLDRVLAETTSRAQHLWSQARHTGDASEFLPVLETLVSLKKQEASFLAEPGQELYEALLQSFEPAMTVAQLDNLFDRLEVGLIDLLASLRSKGKLNSDVSFEGLFPVAKQEQYLKDLLPRIGFDMSRGRMDSSAHPFTESIHGNDVRLTVRYKENNILDAYFSLLHEAGHGLYEQGFLEKWHFSPLAEAVSLGVHESQSRFWENCVGRSKEFWEGEYPLLQMHFPEALTNMDLKAFLDQVHKVRLSPIRVESDEVTYNLHILLRYRIERKIFNGELAFEEIEGAWNSEFQKFFGYAPKNASEGFLQDVHWSAGLFGYFPTYTLGNIWSAQIRNRLMQEFPHWSEMLQQGRFAPILQWLREMIHEPSRQLSPMQLMRQATGVDIDPQALLDYLSQRYNAES